MYTISKNGQLCVWDCSIDLDGLVPETDKKTVEPQTNCDVEDDIVSKENGIPLKFLFLIMFVFISFIYFYYEFCSLYHCQILV